MAKHDAIVTLGDFNVKLGKEQDTIRRHSLHEVANNSSLRLVQYATINNVEDLSTWYPRKNIHKGTWKIPGTNDNNKIDRIIVSKTWATDTENFRTYRGANADSDHFLVGARLKQTITLIIRNRTECCKRRYVEKCDEIDVERQYQQEVQRKLQEKSPSNNTEEEWTYTRWFKYDRDWFVCKQAALRSSCATLRE